LKNDYITGRVDPLGVYPLVKYTIFIDLYLPKRDIKSKIL